MQSLQLGEGRSSEQDLGLDGKYDDVITPELFLEGGVTQQNRVVLVQESFVGGIEFELGHTRRQGRGEGERQCQGEPAKPPYRQSHCFESSFKALSDRAHDVFPLAISPPFLAISPEMPFKTSSAMFSA